MSATATARPTRRQAALPDKEPTLRQRFVAAANQNPEVLEAAGKVAELQAVESGCLASLRELPGVEDPHKHESTRARLEQARSELTVARQRLSAAREAAAMGFMDDFRAERAKAVERFQAAINDLIESTEELVELSDVIRELKLPIRVTDGVQGGRDMQTLLPRLRHILGVSKGN